MRYTVTRLMFFNELVDEMINDLIMIRNRIIPTNKNKKEAIRIINSIIPHLKKIDELFMDKQNEF